MQRSIVAALVALSLGACSSENDATSNNNGSVASTPNMVDVPLLSDDTDVADVADESVNAGDPTEELNSTGETAENDSAANDDVVVGDSLNPDTPPSNSDGTGQSEVVGNTADAPAGDGGSSDTESQGEDRIVPVTENDGSTSGDGDNSDSVGISDDAGSATSEGSETAPQNPDAENSQDDATGQNTDSAISDDAGSATSDGGETASQNTDAENSQDDATGQNADGEISDDAGSATSDGGETASENPDGENGQDDAAGENTDGVISDDAGSATSDGGQTNTDDAGDDTIESDNTTDDNVDGSDGDNADPDVATDFESDNTGSTFLRRSALSAGSQVNICSTASDQQNFSDTQIGDFILHNNVWRPQRAAPGYEWSQCIYTDTNGALAGWNYDWGPGISGIGGNPDPSGDYYVRSYPELIYGVKDEYRTSAPKAVTGLPVRLSELPNISISYSYDGPQYGDSRTVTASSNPRFPNGSTISGERNIAIESFLYNPDANGECSENIVSRNGGSNHVYEVMVWLDAGAERLPAGPSDFVTDVNIRGEAFKVYTKGSDNRYIAFVAQNPQTSGTLVWNDFTDWARTFAHRVSDEFGANSNSVEIQDSWCVANIIVGTEIFWGAGNLDIYDWTITQSR